MNLILKRYSQPDQQIQKLLLTADPDEQKINEYLTTGIAYAAYYQSSLVGTVVLLPQTANQIELVNHGSNRKLTTARNWSSVIKICD